MNSPDVFRTDKIVSLKFGQPVDHLCRCCRSACQNLGPTDQTRRVRSEVKRSKRDIPLDNGFCLSGQICSLILTSIGSPFLCFCQVSQSDSQ